jgi:hypothetical protein
MLGADDDHHSHDGRGAHLLKNLLLGDAQALEGAPLDGQSFMAPLAPPGNYFTGHQSRDQDRE